MGKVRVTAARIRAGVWEAVIDAPGASDNTPDLEITHQDEPIAGLVLDKDEQSDSWRARLPLPASLLSDGVQSFLIRDRQSGEVLDRFTIITGVPMEDDLRAEIDLLRAELDMIKKAFRRHCLDTSDR